MPPAMTDPATTGATHGWAAAGAGFASAAAPIATAAPSAINVFAISPSSHIRRPFTADEAT